MRFRHATVAALVLAVLPQAAHSQARITPVLSTTMQRTCDAETSSLMVMDGGQAVTGASPTREAQIRGLRVSRAPGGHLFEQTVTAPAGDVLLRFNVASGGAVSGAGLSGSAMDAYAAAAPQADLAELASAFAEDVPERLLVDRSLAVGDSYYPDALRRSLIARVIGGLGLPFAVDGSVDVYYRGEVVHEGRRAWRFTGDMTVQGAGAVEGRTLAMNQATTVEILHDVETALVLSYSTAAETRVDLDGQPFRIMKNTDAYACEIVPQ